LLGEFAEEVRASSGVSASVSIRLAPPDQNGTDSRDESASNCQQDREMSSIGGAAKRGELQ
jgi:hypothetical protein